MYHHFIYSEPEQETNRTPVITRQSASNDTVQPSTSEISKERSATKRLFIQYNHLYIIVSVNRHHNNYLLDIDTILYYIILFMFVLL